VEWFTIAFPVFPSAGRTVRSAQGWGVDEGRHDSVTLHLTSISRASGLLINAR